MIMRPILKKKKATLCLGPDSSDERRLLAKDHALLAQERLSFQWPSLIFGSGFVEIVRSPLTTS